ncbi:imidazolonepropionase [Sphingomonas changbaiensis NBRC 104936]|uniref:Imidazolonepropionase n=1 Tax=Sphingomonas changbaiensis NBRC 104936 TaxID=1219043 RepID=A0A0E9MQI5_9SPHN|nr:imidazolonepropionase [Sphingomonas changbaiensis]GAO39819.1 imidazolonepropionase [Sphingomonas changbaiensis NBRC 104936]
MRADTLWTNARLLTMAAGSPVTNEPGAIAAKDGRIVHVGPGDVDAERVFDCEGRLVTPGLIDCHTHLVYAGNRATEFELRLKGASYEEIARAGGGIVSTMRHTREASEAALIEQALPRLDALIAEGVTTIEIKSGYGLDLDSERKMLRAARSLAEDRPVRVATTFLGAHALPPEFAGRADAFIDAVCEMIPVLGGLADAVDAFCEGIGFSSEQVERVFAAARKQGLPVKLHAEQLSNLHGAALAARYGALSADHLEHLDEAGVAAMSQAGTIATLLPGAYYFTRETRLPPIGALRAVGVPIALATDCNPGTSPMTSLLLVMNMAATLFRMTVEECLLGVTRNAAAALGLAGEVGTLEPGKACDLAIWDVREPAELVYRIGFNPLHARVFGGGITALRA